MVRASIPHYISKYDFKRSDFIIWLEDCARWVSNKENQSFSSIFVFWKDFLKKHNINLSPVNTIEERKRLFSVLTESKVYSHSLLKWVKFTLGSLDLVSLLEKSNVYPDELDNIKELVEVVMKGNLSGSSIEKFSTIGKPLNQVTLSTRHSSKGLEFEVVILLGMEEGNFPFFLSVKDPQKLAEEHRVFFVCISRARRICYLLRSKKITIHSKQYGSFIRDKEPSMFWNLLYEKYGEEI